MILGELTYQEKQSIAVASKESFLLVGRIMVSLHDIHALFLSITSRDIHG